eukprot:m.106971 g.106971  ORF g.106971 m.106971 type:complete len:82 (+) comp27762_c0_seq1:414-659(+)
MVVRVDVCYVVHVYAGDVSCDNRCLLKHKFFQILEGNGAIATRVCDLDHLVDFLVRNLFPKRVKNYSQFSSIYGTTSTFVE